jgi:hypothetical protein
VATALLNPLLEMLSCSRDACGGDADKFLIVLAVVIRAAQHPIFQTLSPEDLISGEIPVFPSLGVNVRSIATSIGIPKESVRRKILELVKEGWIVRRGRDLYCTAEAYRQLAPVSESLQRLALRHFDVVSACLEDGDVRS